MEAENVCHRATNRTAPLIVRAKKARSSVCTLSIIREQSPVGLEAAGSGEKIIKCFDRNQQQLQQWMQMMTSLVVPITFDITIFDGDVQPYVTRWPGTDIDLSIRTSVRQSIRQTTSVQQNRHVVGNRSQCLPFFPVLACRPSLLSLLASTFLFV